MKVLYICHAADWPSGWATAAVDYVLAMDSVGIDVVPRIVRLSRDNTAQLPSRFLELMQKDTADCDVVIQHVLPHHLQFDGHFKRNIALCVYESGGQWLHNWASKINAMDELWVPSSFTETCFIKGGVKVPITIVPHTFSFPIATTKEKLDIPELRGDYIFYTIADLNVRKNLPTIIQAFHREFTINEPVSLLIKTGKFGLHPNQTLEIIDKDCSSIKEHMKLYTNINLYKKEYIITLDLTREDLIKLHNTCNCYVNASHGEAWCIPLFEAMAIGNQVVNPSKMYDYSSPYGYDVETYTGMNLRCNDTFQQVGTSRETWQNISPVELGEKMRMAYNDFRSDKDAPNRQRRINRAEIYSYANIGNIIKRLING